MPFIGSAISLFRITDRRSVEKVRTELAADASVRSVQLNFRYVLQDQKSVPAEGDPAQYALAKLRLPEAHALSRGANVTVAVIDSGIDVTHPELVDAIAESFDALGAKEGPHVHGTGIAGAIVSHARLMGSAPKARILAIRAFGAAANGAESTSFVILKSLDFAAMHGAQIVNMSFAGPKDPLLERGIAAAATKGMVLVAASGNAGPKSPPLYPAANPNVIAVSATDAHDRLFPASNRGGHIAVSAPGVDIFLPAPDGKYQMTSGTSFSAAYISGLAALMMERNPQLAPAEVRAILTKTARDLGAPRPRRFVRRRRGRCLQCGDGGIGCRGACCRRAGPAACRNGCRAASPSRNTGFGSGHRRHGVGKAGRKVAFRAEKPPSKKLKKFTQLLNV